MHRVPRGAAAPASALRWQLALLLPMAGCLGGASLPPEAPAVPVLVEWAEGTRFAVAVADGLPETPAWRAAPAWWREALRQTPRFALDEGGAPGLPTLVLHADPETGTLTAALRDGDGERMLAGATCEAPPVDERDLAARLPAAIDRLAWAARIALGEVAAAPLPVARGTSADPTVVTAVTEAFDLSATGAYRGALLALRKARRRDGGAPFLLEPLAAAELLNHDPTLAQRLCTEALGYEPRLLPTTAHRLGRTLLLAQAALDPAHAGEHDRRLLQFAELARSERPYDDEVLFSVALAHNYRDEWAAARPLLERLRRSMPTRGGVHYHLGWACLAMGDAAAAVDHFAEAASRMFATWVLLPRAIALYESGHGDELDDLLATTLTDEARGADDLLHHQLRRMRAALCILRGEVGDARAELAGDLRWLAAHPLALQRDLGAFVEEGALLVRFGGSSDLSGVLAAVQATLPGTATADAVAFVHGLDRIRVTQQRQLELEEQLSRGGDSAWAQLLAAYAHELRGEVGEQQTALARAALMSEAPSTKALLAMSLRAVGRIDEADALHTALLRELRAVRLRAICQHPVFGPEFAFAAVAAAPRRAAAARHSVGQ